MDRPGTTFYVRPATRIGQPACAVWIYREGQDRCTLRGRYLGLPAARAHVTRWVKAHRQAAGLSIARSLVEAA